MPGGQNALRRRCPLPPRCSLSRRTFLGCTDFIITMERMERIEENTTEEHLVDVDQLLALVRGHPVIYNLALKEHHNQDVLSKIWTDISKELNVPVQVCKTKWSSLRNGYNRYLRELKKNPSGSAQKRKKWHLFDAMSFLQPFTGPTRVMSSNLKLSSQQATSPFLPETESIEAQAIYESELEMGPTEFAPIKKKKKTAAEIVAAPMADFLKAATEKRMQCKEENPMLTFFKSLIPDTDLLTCENKRKFKLEVMTMLNNLIHQQQVSPSSNSAFTNVSNNSTGTYQELEFWSSDDC